MPPVHQAPATTIPAPLTLRARQAKHTWRVAAYRTLCRRRTTTARATLRLTKMRSRRLRCQRWPTTKCPWDRPSPTSPGFVRAIAFLTDERLPSLRESSWLTCREARQPQLRRRQPPVPRAHSHRAACHQQKARPTPPTSICTSPKPSQVSKSALLSQSRPRHARLPPNAPPNTTHTGSQS